MNKISDIFDYKQFTYLFNYCVKYSLDIGQTNETRYRVYDGKPF